MAKIECELQGNYGEILSSLEDAVMSGSLSASREDSSDFSYGDCICAVRVFERYSMLGKNRVSLSFTLLQCGGRIFLSAITSGGSQAVFFKINTLGEESFLSCLENVTARYAV